MSVHRVPKPGVRSPRLVEIISDDAPANDPQWERMQRRIVALFAVLLAMLAAALLLNGSFA